MVTQDAGSDQHDFSASFLYQGRVSARAGQWQSMPLWALLVSPRLMSQGHRQGAHCQPRDALCTTRNVSHRPNMPWLQMSHIAAHPGMKAVALPSLERKWALTRLVFSATGRPAVAALPGATTSYRKAQQAPSPQCAIKGNISANGEHLYHTPGSRSYSSTVIDEQSGERWFCSEQDAQRAGWRAPKA